MSNSPTNPSIESFLNKVTLDCLINKDQYNKYVSNTIIKSINRKDKKFYRKRIYNLAKELLLSNEEPQNLMPDVKHAFDNFVNSCIHYFKIIDRNDINQEEYKLLTTTLNNIPELEVDDNIQNKEDADKLLMRSIKIEAPSLDQFVKIKYTKRPEDMFLPKQKEIDLKDPALKIKGILKSGKKKNITNKYDEKNNKNEKNKKNEKNEETKEESST